MQSRNLRDVTSGLTLLALGLFCAWYAQDYQFGTLRRIGPGFFPVALGVLMACLGAAIAVSGLVSAPTETERFEPRPAIAVLAAIMAFALLLRPAGMVPATVALALLATLADARLRLPFGLALAAGLTLLGWLIFVQLLGLPMQPFSSRFLALIGAR